MGTKTQRVALGDINIDTRWRIRDIDSHKIAVFRDRIATGAAFPALLVDQGMTLIDGHHRYEAYMRSYEPDHVISVKVREFTDEKERLKAAGSMNAENGFPLTAFEEKRLAFRLKTLGADEDEVSAAIGRPVSKILRWHGDAILVIDGKESEERPRKGGVDKSVKKMTAEQYETMERRYSGWSPVFHCEQILTHLSNGTINFDDSAVVEKLQELVDAISAVLKGRAA